MSHYDDKLHQDRNVLEPMFLKGLTSKQIGKELHISYKLVNYWLIHFNLIKRTPEIELP
jgi:DNA-directed RNA polymerase specialized sigma subunit